MPTFQVACVGMHFRGPDAKQMAMSLTADSALRIEREPENQYDEYALRVMFHDLHIGYVERQQAAWISPLIDEGGVASVRFLKQEERGRNFHPILEIEISNGA